jgi:hypothetical protein
MPAAWANSFGSFSKKHQIVGDDRRQCLFLASFPGMVGTSGTSEEGPKSLETQGIAVS